MTIRADDIVRYFSLDEGSGSDITDSKTGDIFTLQNGGIIGVPIWVSPGVIGDAMLRQAVADTSFYTWHINDFDPLPHSASWAMSCHLNADSAQQDNDGWPISRWDGSSGNREWTWRYRNASHAEGPSIGFACRMLDASETEQTLYVSWGSDSPESGAWAFVAWDHDTSTLSLFVDGVLRDSQVAGGTGPHELVSATSSETRFSFFQPYGFGSTNAYGGDIDEVGFFAGRTFGEDDAEWIYNDGEGRSYEQLLEPDPPTDEETFKASFEDASGRDPLATALIERTPARRLANHNVIVYKYPPYLVTKRVPIELEDYSKTLPGNMLWHKDPNSALFSMGRWAQIQGRRFTDNPVEVELTLRISDHPESFEAPS